MGREISPVFEDRVSRGMSRAEYAEFLGYTHIESGVRRIQRWESGDAPRTARALSLLCGATGRRASFFLGQEEEAPAPSILSAVYRELGEMLLAKAAEAAELEKVA